MGRIDRRIARISQTLNASCELGSVTEYLDLLQAAGRASKAERRRAKESYKQEIDDSWNAVVTGMLYAFARGGELDYGVVLSISERKIRVVDIYGELFWVRRDDLSSQLRELGFFDIPFGRSVRDRQVRNDIAELIEDRVAERVDLDLDADLERSWDRHAVRTSPVLEAHPVHSCPERYEHRRAGSEYMTLMTASANCCSCAILMKDRWLASLMRR